MLDIQPAIRYLKEHDSDLQIDADQLVVIGNSKSNSAHVVATEYFDLSPIETSAALGLPLVGYEPDAIDALPATIAVSVYNYGAMLILDSEGTQTSILDSNIYSEENFKAGYQYPDFYLICGNLDGVTASIGTAVTEMHKYNQQQDKLYPINWETHIINKVPHGVGAGLNLSNYAAMWDELYLFLTQCLQTE